MNLRSFLSVVLPMLAVATTWSQEAEFNPLGRDEVDVLEKQMLIQVEWIELDAAAATKLLMPADPAKPKPHRPSNAGALRKTLQEKIDKGEADLVDSTMVTARSGNRAKVESIHEFIYPTEYSGGEILNPANAKPVHQPPLPTAFETRNLGATLEVDPVLGADQRTIDLNLAPELVYLVGTPSWGIHRSEGGEVEVKTPSFYTVKVTTQVALIAGEYGLIAIQTPRDLATGMPDPKRRIFVFVKADLSVVGLPLEE